MAMYTGKHINTLTLKSLEGKPEQDSQEDRQAGKSQSQQKIPVGEYTFNSLQVQKKKTIPKCFFFLIEKLCKTNSTVGKQLSVVAMAKWANQASLVQVLIVFITIPAFFRNVLTNLKELDHHFPTFERNQIEHLPLYLS